MYLYSTYNIWTMFRTKQHLRYDNTAFKMYSITISCNKSIIFYHE